MFSSMAPLYFVFHHLGDKYYRDSMLALSFERYLTLRLHENGFQHVFFLNAEGDSFLFQIYDRDSYAKNDFPGVLGSKYLWKSWDKKNRSLTVDAGSEEVAKWLVQRMGENQTAVVTNAATLRRLLQKNKKQYEKLCSLFRHFHSSGTIVVTAPMCLGQTDLQDIVRLFRELPELFPEFSALLSDSATTYFFDALRMHAPDRMIELGDISGDELRTILRNVAFIGGTEIPDAEFEEYVSYLYYWLHSSRLRTDDGLFKSLQPPFQRKKLFSVLKQDGNLQQLKKTIDWKKEKKPYLMQVLIPSYGAKDALHRETVCIDHGVLRNIAQITCPDSSKSTGTGFDIAKPSMQEWAAVCDELLKPQVQWPDTQWASCVTNMYHIWKKAAKQQDHDTQLRAINVMHCCIRNRDNDYGRSALSYLECSQALFSQQRYLANAGGSDALAEALWLKDAANYKQLSEILKKGDVYYVPKPIINTSKFSDMWAQFDNLTNSFSGDFDDESVEQTEKKTAEQIRAEYAEYDFLS